MGISISVVLLCLLKLVFGEGLGKEIELCSPINVDYTLFTLCPFAAVPNFYEGDRYGYANFSIQEANLYKCGNSTDESWGTYYDISTQSCIDVASETPKYRLQSEIL